MVVQSFSFSETQILTKRFELEIWYDGINKNSLFSILLEDGCTCSPLYICRFRGCNDILESVQLANYQCHGCSCQLLLARLGTCIGISNLLGGGFEIGQGENMEGVLVDDLNEPTMGEKLASLNMVDDGKATHGNEEREKSTRLRKPPCADLVNIWLKQALHADDRALLLDCLYTLDEKVISYFKFNQAKKAYDDIN